MTPFLFGERIVSSIHLVHRYVVEQILSIATKCEFKNYGGTGRGLVDRIMGSFNIPETGWLQAVYTGNILNSAKLMDLIKNKLDEDQLEDVIDVWKELCNKSFSESSIMDHARNFEAEIRSRGFGKKPFFELDVDEWTVVLRTVDNTIKSARGYFEKAFNSTTVEEFNGYQQKLLRTLVTYPYIQETFIEDSFSQQLRHHLQAMSDPVVRTEHLITKLKEENDFLFKEVKVKQSKEGTEIMLDRMYKQHPHAKPYIHFLGTDHHIGHSFHFNANVSRFAQECDYIRSLMLDLPKDGKIPLCGIKSIIHRSAYQKRLCQELFIDKDNWKDFDKMDSQERGIQLDKIFDLIMVNTTPTVDKASKRSSLPDYPNLAEEEVPVEDSRYLAIIKELYPVVEDRINLIEQLSDKLADQFKVLMAVTPFDPSGECKNPNCRVHNKSSKIIDLLRQHQNPIDNFIGIDLESLETQLSQVTQLKSRQPHPFDLLFNETPVEDGNLQNTVLPTEPTIGTEMVSRVIIIDNNRHELMFNTVTKRMTIFGAGKQIYTGIVKDEDQAVFVWERYKTGTVIDVGVHAINAAIAQLNGL